MLSLKNNPLKILIAFLVLFLAISILKDKSRTIRIALTDSAAPALKSFHSVLANSKRIIPFASLREENKKLRNRLELLSRKLEETKTICDENLRLQGLLDFKKSVPYATIPAQVIARDPSNWSNSLVIDRGSNHGIRQNMAVLSTRGLVGRVAAVGKYSSKVLLITDPNSKVGVLIQRNRQGGVLVGRPDGRCRMIYISLDSDVSRGDKVITAGLGAVFPKNILIGEVMGVYKEPGRIYKYAIVKSAQELSRLEEVLCIK